MQKQKFYHKEKSIPLSLKYVLEGEEKYKVEGKLYNLKKGQLLIIPEGKTVESFCEKTERTIGISAFLSNSLLNLIDYDIDNSLEQNKPKGNIKVNEIRLVQNYNQYLSPIFYNISQSFGKIDLDVFYKKEVFYKIAESLSEFTSNYQNKLNSLGNIRHSTKKELL